MVDDPYSVLGVPRNAADDDLRAAYRKLAKALHPDFNPGDKQAEERFKKVASAYDILSDPAKRKRFDHGEIDAAGNERPPQYRPPPGASRGGAGGRPQGGGFEPFEDLFGDLFGRGGSVGRGGGRRGQDRKYLLEIEFLEAVNGARKRVNLPEGDALDINIPVGVEDGQSLRLKGKGAPGLGAAESGDALIDIKVRHHAYFKREDDDILLELPLSLPEAVLGAKVEVPTVTGRVTLTVPKGTSGGQVFRLKGKGVANPRARIPGDQLVKVKIVLPEPPEPELDRFLQGWKGKGYDAGRKW